VVATIALAALTACGPGPGSGDSPTVAPPAAEHPTPAVPAAPVPAFVNISALSIGVGDSDSLQLVDVPFTTDLATAAAQLTAAIVTPVAATACFPATQIYDWGGLQIAYDPFMTDFGASQFVATVTATHTTGGLELDAPFNQTVGMTLDEVLANVPGSVSGDRGEGHIEALLDPQQDGLWGVIMTFTDGVANGFHSPGVYIFGHGTCEGATD
jgi:hypothetical protein